jgi:hypothetical protein
LLNNQAFRFFQMHHIISIMISNAKGRFKDLFICLVARSGLAKLELSPQFETNNFLQRNILRINACLIPPLVLSKAHMHMNPEPYVFSLALILCSICFARVASKKTLCFI